MSSDPYRGREASDWHDASSPHARTIITALHPDFRPLAEVALKQGWSLRKQGNTHVQYRPPREGADIVVSSVTPSDFRAVRKHRSLLVRSGLRLNLREELEAETRERDARIRADRERNDRKLAEAEERTKTATVNEQLAEALQRPREFEWVEEPDPEREEQLEQARMRQQRMIAEAKDSVRKRHTKGASRRLLEVLFDCDDGEMYSDPSFTATEKLALLVYELPDEFTEEQLADARQRMTALISLARQAGHITTHSIDKPGRVDKIVITEAGAVALDEFPSNEPLQSISETIEPEDLLQLTEHLEDILHNLARVADSLSETAHLMRLTLELLQRRKEPGTLSE